MFGLLSAASLTALRCRRPSETDVSGLAEFSSYDGVGLSQLYRNGSVSARELVDETLRRVDTVNPQLNAVLTDLFDVEKARARAQGPLGNSPLSGVPVMLKNLTRYNDALIDSGSRLVARARERGTLPPVDNSPLVDAMEDAGMIVTGITNSPEFGLIDVTEPVLHGPSRNPWNLEMTPGGSSGGTGAAVAAGLVPLAHGNDGGGSIRLPASHCGIVGLKPTRGRELGSNDGPLSLANNLCLSRTVRDTAAFLSVVERKDNSKLPSVGYVEGSSDRRLRIALMLESTDGEGPERSVAEGLRATADLCAELGHSVQEIPSPIDGPEFMDTFLNFWSTGTLRRLEAVSEWLGENVAPEEVLEPWTLGLAKRAAARGPEQSVERAEDVFGRAAGALEALFETYDVILSPVLTVPPFPIGYHDPTGDFDTIMARVAHDVGYTPLHNAAGTPAISLPLHWTNDGLPVGNQFAAWRGGERTLLELAYELEGARPWRDKRPPVFAG